MPSWQTLLIIAGAILAGGVLVLALFSLTSRRPDNLGVRDGKLAACPSSPNCVCTQAADGGHRIEPLAYTGSPEEAKARLKAVLSGLPRGRIVSETDNYLHAEFTSRLFRFVDDVEFLIEPGGVIHFRSASRAGHSDLGVNRARMEAIRQSFEQGS
jgi:uncharacterized protein (DUF1499 family)